MRKRFSRGLRWLALYTLLAFLGHEAIDLKEKARYNPGVTPEFRRRLNASRDWLNLLTVPVYDSYAAKGGVAFTAVYLLMSYRASPSKDESEKEGIP